eukprot:2209297-Pyramimonas_sp.AAC.1
MAPRLLANANGGRAVESRLPSSGGADEEAEVHMQFRQRVGRHPCHGCCEHLGRKVDAPWLWPLNRL